MKGKTRVVLGSSFLVALLACAPTSARAQVTRDRLIEDAFGEFDSARRIELLVEAVSPELGPTDSLWAVGVQLLAQTLLEEGNDVMATVWLRWATRLDPGLQIDALQFLPEVADAQRAAGEFVARGEPAAEAAVSTSYRWPAGPPFPPVGRIQVQPSTLPVTLRVEVGGIGVVDPESGLSLAAGSYEIVAYADGYESARVTREVLPGVTTVLEFAPVPILSDEIATASLQRLVRVEYRQQDEFVCRTGFFAGGERTVLTTHAVLGDVDDVELASTDSRLAARELRVAAHDADRGVTVLTVPTAWANAMPVAQDISDGQYVWAVHYRDCESAEVTRTRIVAWHDRPEGELQLEATLPEAGVGGPIVNHSGAVVGVVTGASAALPAPHALLVLERAQRNLAAGRLLTLQEAARDEGAPGVEGGKFPYHWAALGVAAVGIAAAVLLGGGGGDDAPDTGAIVVTFPN
jgi:hypothetical protein